MTKPRKTRRAKRKAKRKAAPSAPGNAGLGKANRALLDAEEAVPEDDLSVEDPLQDWPETETEKDRWLRERGDGRDEPPDS